MFEKMPLSDVTFNILGRKFAAHKNILTMRSPVFAAMFRHPTKEMQSNQVEVKDVDHDVFQEILRFIYTGKTQSTVMDKMAPGFFAAADKYLMEDLKIQCETHLIRQMSAENCLELLSLTTHHPAEHLKKYAIDYFRRYSGKSIVKFNYHADSYFIYYAFSVRDRYFIRCHENGQLENDEGRKSSCPVRLAANGVERSSDRLTRSSYSHSFCTSFT